MTFCNCVVLTLPFLGMAILVSFLFCAVNVEFMHSGFTWLVTSASEQAGPRWQIINSCMLPD